ncbi:putative RNA methyltransferase At5g51130 [Diplonema papillatum]|nr:putative RNA methyltransferase At5g51130 [Diplonema papillatum]|eukprot:gene6048-9288_t
MSREELVKAGDEGNGPSETEREESHGESSDELVIRKSEFEGAFEHPAKRRRRTMDEQASKLTEEVTLTGEYTFGNYDRYYGYRALVNDPRVAALESIRHLLAGKAWLDVGCNNGQLTTLLAERLSAGSALGIDVDERLIRRADRLLAERHNELRKKLLPIYKELAALPSPSYFPVASSVGVGPLPDVRCVPDVTFRAANIVNARHNIPLPRNEHAAFDVVFCLSVTKWVHLNWGDRGLRVMFLRIYDLLTPDGLLVLEPQPWKSYAKAATRLADASILNKRSTLSLRPQQFDEHLRGLGFVLEKNLIEREAKGFSRDLLVYRKTIKP